LVLEPGYSVVANEQLDEILDAGDNDLYNNLIDACEGILDRPGAARVHSSAVKMEDGSIVFRYPVPDRAPYKVFWSSDGPTIEAVFPYRT
jgi:hypothetical protein